MNDMARAAALPFLSGETGRTRYLEEIRRFPMLEPQEEFILAKRWRKHNDRDAAHKLVTSHLQLVVKIAVGYRGYGLPISDLISEGNVGLIQAVERFKPDKGLRLTTYAMWWIAFLAGLRTIQKSARRDAEANLSRDHGGRPWCRQ